MSRTLTARSTLETLKREAKRWLKALRDGDVQAQQRLVAAGVKVKTPGLRDVQLALAHEYGLPGWTALRQALEDLALEKRSYAERIDIVLRSAWQGDPPAAARILARWPEIGTHSFCAAVVTGNVPVVERYLAADPTLAKRKDGPLSWEPLLYLAYTRLHDRIEDAVTIARTLLDRGADPNAWFNDGWDNPFTVLTGVIGEGEGDKPPHPGAKSLAALLIEYGTSPFDTQTLYNTSICRDDTTWLEFLWIESERGGKVSSWREVGKIGGKIPVSALDYLLGNAVAFNHLRRAEWLLQHGANPNALHAYSTQPVREEALTYGYTAMADLLVRYGAASAPLEPHVAFRAACMAMDVDTARALAQEHPAYLRDAWPMLTAARMGRADIVALLLDLGMDVDVADSTLQRGLHNAVMGNSIEVVKLLIAHGADIDRPTTRFGGSLGFAAHFGRRELAALLAPLSKDIPDLTYLGMTDRLRELFTADPTLVNAFYPRFDATPLFALPDDEDAAAEVASFLLAHGADPKIKNKEGLTAEQAARQRGLIDAADLLAPH